MVGWLDLLLKESPKVFWWILEALLAWIFLDFLVNIPEELAAGSLKGRLLVIFDGILRKKTRPAGGIGKTQQSLDPWTHQSCHGRDDEVSH